MRSFLAVVVCTLGLTGIVSAQSPPASSLEPSRGYVEGVAQSAFGNEMSASQSYGAEMGFKVKVLDVLDVSPNLEVFVEGGRTRNIASGPLLTSAVVIVGILARAQASPVTFTAREPVTFVVAGVKYLIPTKSRAEPYVMGGFGIARTTADVHFLVGGTDITGNITQFGVTLGGDLSGTSTRPMLTLGGGVAWPIWQRLLIDFQYRYGRIFVPDQGVNLSRAGAGIGLRF